MDKYSVLMSVYCKEKAEYFRGAIESMLTQTVPPDEFVIVCDGPLTKELDNVINEYIAKYPEIFNVKRLETNVGLGNALNAGIKECRNELVARMDSDDISKPCRCERELEIFAMKEVDIVSGTIAEFEGDITNVLSKRILPENMPEIMKFARKRNPFNHMPTMYKKSSVQAAGGYMDMPYFEDHYLWLRMLENGAKGYNIQDVIAYARVGKDMYKRRGGAAYIKGIITIKTYMYKHGFSSFVDYILSLSGHVFVAICPNWLRKKIYNGLLRR